MRHITQERIKINTDIRAKHVRTIDSDGTQVGVVSLDEAISLAEKKGLDLVEVAPNAEPPVCRIMDYGKYRYEQTKKTKEAKKKQQAFKIKELKIRPNIEQHDYQTKLKHGQEFLDKGYKLKVSVTFRGRELAHRDIGFHTLERFLEDISEFGTVEMKPKDIGRDIIAMIAPGKSKK
ncbi:MAG: translation initiation factor IF-3 [Candidatus Auribacter fodinae]|uniref:Translation initiation factor IF-3 n=1 Tax=Candidatus Auribacter fodinae TaxID=2093366 RepID=A0A3A4R5P3_9BACT|nr:MAG: translation initiation factor IF-3 [Candidatus Auribacter fodinae]